MPSFLELVQGVIADADSVNDLINIVQHVPLQSLKNLMNESVKTMNEDKLRSIHFESASIHDIISCDVIQSALSFIPQQASLKYVNKSFNKLAQKNEMRLERSRERMISSKFTGKNVWHLRGNQLQKNNEEPQSIDRIELMKNAFDLVEEGDKLLIHEGEYELDDYYFSKSIQIEGEGRCCIATTMTGRSYLGENVCCAGKDVEVSIKNIEFDAMRFRTKANACLYLTGCQLYGDSQACCDQNCKLDCHGCYFEGHDDEQIKSSILGRGPCVLSVVNCEFDCCGGFKNDPVICLDKETKKMDLKLIGNRFTNTYPNAFFVGGGSQCHSKVQVNKKARIAGNIIGKSDSCRKIRFMHWALFQNVMQCKGM